MLQNITECRCLIQEMLRNVTEYKGLIYGMHKNVTDGKCLFLQMIRNAEAEITDCRFIMILFNFTSIFTTTYLVFCPFENRSHSKFSMEWLQNQNKPWGDSNF